MIEADTFEELQALMAPPEDFSVGTEDTSSKPESTNACGDAPAKGPNGETCVIDEVDVLAERDKEVETRPPIGVSYELDEDHRPWDGRIDSSAKSKTVDGRWKIKRGTDPALVAQVKAEYATAHTEDPRTETPIAPPAETPVAPPAAETAIAPPADAPAAMDYPTFLQTLMGAAIPPATVTAALAKYNIAAMPQLAGKPEVIPALVIDLGL